MAANYNLFITCDCDKCGEHLLDPEQAQFEGKMWVETSKEALDKGWKINHSTGKSYAPGHSVEKSINTPSLPIRDIDLAS